MPSVVVRIVGEGDDDEDDPEIAVVVRAVGDKVTVKMEDSDEVRTLSASAVRPVVPQRNDAVMIIDADKKGLKGTLIGIDHEDGIVKIGSGGSDILIKNLSVLVKYKEDWV
jgi:hypothetical protein